MVGGRGVVGGGGVVGVDQSSDFSLSNVQPFNPSDAQVAQSGLGRSAGGRGHYSVIWGGLSLVNWRRFIQSSGGGEALHPINLQTIMIIYIQLKYK